MIKLLEGLSIQTGLPVDDRSIAKTFEERDNIPETVRYLGMKVYVEDAKKEYTLREGLSNDFWVEVRAIALSSELITDPDHLTVTQDEKDWWDSKAEGKHTHTKKEITDFPSSIKNPNSITISLDGTSQGAYDGSTVKNINITPENINASRNNHTHTKNQITDFPASLKNPTAITIQANGSSLGSYDGSAAKTFNLTATNVGAYTKAETNDKLNTKLNISGGTLTGALTVNSTVKTTGALTVGSTIKATGTVTCSDCVTTSDKRLKKDIVKIDNALEKVNKLNGYTFLKDGDNKRTTGLLAQELLEVLPESVYKKEDGYYSVAYGNIVGLLIEAIKELENEIKTLKR